MMNTKTEGYDKWPKIAVKAAPGSVFQGWEQIGAELAVALEKEDKTIAVFDCYQGVFEDELVEQLALQDITLLRTVDYMLSPEAIAHLVYPDVTDDEVFGYLSRLNMIDFFDLEKLNAARTKIAALKSGKIGIVGPGAALLCAKPDLLVYLDMPRWEIQQRFRRNEVSNLGADHVDLKTALQYKRAFFVDWRVCDRHKKTLMHHWDYVIDTAIPGKPVMVKGALLLDAFAATVNRPFRLVPFFDPGPWGGQWMKERFDLDPAQANYAWCFDCVPEENSILYLFEDHVVFESPAINVVFSQAEKLLGAAVQARFGDEFPIRFDFLDTMGGGNLSLQVHPTTAYIQEKFGMHYTQDESYYMLDAAEDAIVYLGLKDEAEPDEMIAALNHAQNGGVPFPADQFAAQWPVKKHDHILIPAGTIHCSGKNSMVLEVSATPFIFTFKLWDWGRMGLDGLPRPVNISHGKEVIDWRRRETFSKNELINVIEPLSSGEGWREERTGLHEREFIETRRHWFTKSVTHTGNGSVHVINLVEGDRVIIESPDQQFDPYIIHYAETFIIPAHIKAYTITPYKSKPGQQYATLKAFVRIQP